MSVDLKLERHIALRPDECFALWSRPEDIASWWGPRDEADRPFRSTVHAWSAKPGERWSITMTAPDGRQFQQSGVMLEVQPPNRLRFSFAWVENGQLGPETEIRITFQVDGSGTHMTFEQINFPTLTSRDSHRHGWSQCLDRLAAFAIEGQEVTP